jgi:FkbM family methyltransferase
MSFKNSVENGFNKLLGKLGYKIIKIEAGGSPPQAVQAPLFQDNVSLGALNDINAGLAFLKHLAVNDALTNKMFFYSQSREFSFAYNDREVRLFLPYALQDSIQRHIAYNDNFFEVEWLKKSLAFIKEGAVILDIGANIGNHTVFWSLFSPAARILSFEPQRLVFNILKRNIELNHCENVQIFQNVISDKKGKALVCGDPDQPYASNLGGKGFFESSTGEYDTITIDSLNILPVDFVKIDVEGHQDTVLLGMKETLAKCSPTMWIEVFPPEFNRTNELLESMNYKISIQLGANDFIYTKAE